MRYSKMLPNSLPLVPNIGLLAGGYNKDCVGSSLVTVWRPFRYWSDIIRAKVRADSSVCCPLEQMFLDLNGYAFAPEALPD